MNTTPSADSRLSRRFPSIYYENLSRHQTSTFAISDESGRLTRRFLLLYSIRIPDYKGKSASRISVFSAQANKTCRPRRRKQRRKRIFTADEREKTVQEIKPLNAEIEQNAAWKPRRADAVSFLQPKAEFNRKFNRIPVPNGADCSIMLKTAQEAAAVSIFFVKEKFGTHNINELVLRLTE